MDLEGLFGGGQNASFGYENTIGYVTIDTTGNATDFGDLTISRKEGSGAADTTRSLFLGGSASTSSDGVVIDYVTTQTAGNATDFGDLLSYRFDGAASSNGTKAVMTGYYAGATSNVIEQVTIQTAGNSTDFGDLTLGRTGHAGRIRNSIMTKSRNRQFADLADSASIIDASTASYTTAEETKLAGIAASANNYVHPNHSGEVTSSADGATVIASNVVDED